MSFIFPGPLSCRAWGWGGERGPLLRAMGCLPTVHWIAERLGGCRGEDCGAGGGDTAPGAHTRTGLQSPITEFRGPLSGIRQRACLVTTFVLCVYLDPVKVMCCCIQQFLKICHRHIRTQLLHAGPSTDVSDGHWQLRAARDSIYPPPPPCRSLPLVVFRGGGASTQNFSLRLIVWLSG